MANIMQPDQSSADNISLFLDGIQDPVLKSLLENHLSDILAIGAEQDADRSHRNAFFQAIQVLIEQRAGEKR